MELSYDILVLVGEFAATTRSLRRLSTASRNWMSYVESDAECRTRLQSEEATALKKDSLREKKWVGCTLLRSIPTDILLRTAFAMRNREEVTFERIYLNAFASFSRTIQWPSLHSLKLTRCGGDVENFLAAIDAPALQSLQIVNVLNCTSISLLPKTPQLTYANFSGTLVGDDVITALAFGCPKLEHLEVGGCCNVQLVGPLVRCSGLKTLHLAGARVTDAGMVDLSLQRLTHLTLASCHGFSNISRLPEAFPSLISLNLSATNISSRGAGILTFPCLTCLTIERCPRWDNLAPFRECPSLKWLSVAGSALSDGLNGFAAPVLKVLNCNGCSHVSNLSALQFSPNLEKLLLSGTSVKDSDLELMSRFCSQLQLLVLQGCPHVRDFKIVGRFRFKIIQ